MELKSQKDFFDRAEVVDYYKCNYSKEDRNFRIINSLKPGKKVLSLGCGGGREVKELVLRKNKVVAVDIAENMIAQSRKIEPKAKYFCVEAVEFAEKNKDNLKFDYILGLFSFLGYIEKKDMRRLIDNLMKMLNEKGILVFEVRMVNDRVKDVIKAMIAPFYAIILRQSYSFGDIYSKSNVGYTKSHHFSKREIRKLLEGYRFEIRNKSEVYIFK